MATASQFDLNNALQLWLEQLGRSPQVKTENLMELESHVRDSVVQLQTKGLSGEESFLIATHRAGTPAQLEPEFAKINRRPWNMVIQGLILVFFSMSCFFLWGILRLPLMMGHVARGRSLPAFTMFVIGWSSYLAAPPLLAAIYCVHLWTRKSLRGNSWIGFFATTMAVLFLITLPTLIAVLLPVIAFMNN